MKCKRCKKGYTGDCMLTNGICVFCYYKTDTWDSNGQLVTKKESHTAYLRMMREWRRKK